MSQPINRRDFLKLGTSAFALTALPPLPLPPDDLAARADNGFGRVTVDRAWVRSDPDPDAPRVDQRRFDAIVNILDEVKGVGHFDHNPIWYRIVGGYIYSSWVQPVAYRFNQPVTHVEPPGLLAWVTVPYTDSRAQPDASLKRRNRLYYDAIFRVVDVHTDEISGEVWYAVREGLTWKGVNWVQARHLRIIPPEEMAPISPEAEEKHILIEIDKQWLTCFEGKDAVFETRLSSGKKGTITPIGTHRVLSKAPTRRMIGGEGADYYDVPGVGFVTYFTHKGVAVHGTYWHNDYGRRRSHGCVNTPTAAAQWVYRWTQPEISYDKHSLNVRDQNATIIQVVL